MRTAPLTIGARVRQAAGQGLVGRGEELARLTRVLRADQPLVTFVHGLGGVGKTALLSALLPRLEHAGARVLHLDGRDIEPTARGLLRALGAALESELPDAAALGARAQQEAKPLVIAIDYFDALRLIEAWLRPELVMNLPATARVLVFGRHGPSHTWQASPGWAQVMSSVRLGPLSEGGARALLHARGVPEDALPRLLKLAGGHPQH